MLIPKKLKNKGSRWLMLLRGEVLWSTQVLSHFLLLSPLPPPYTSPFLWPFFSTTGKINLAMWCTNITMSLLLEVHTWKAWVRLLLAVQAEWSHQLLNNSSVVSLQWMAFDEVSVLWQTHNKLSNVQYLNGSHSSVSACKASRKGLPLTMYRMKDNFIRTLRKSQ